MANERIFHVGVKALVQNSAGDTLLLRADVSNHATNVRPYWDIPGGRVQSGQTLLETLRREMLEEIGIYQEHGSPELISTIISKHEIPLHASQTVGLLLVVYRVTIPDNTMITLSEEHVAYAWVARTEAKQRLSDKYPVEFTDLL